MTVNEAKYYLLEHKPIVGFKTHNEALDVAIQTLEEIQQYRAIGTVERLKHLEEYVDTINKLCADYSAIGTIEEFKLSKEMEAVYGQVKWERDVAISQLEEIGVGLGQKMEEFKALKEKSVAKKMKINRKHGYEDYIKCPVCNNPRLCSIHKFCYKCGTKFDWSEG